MYHVYAVFLVAGYVCLPIFFMSTHCEHTKPLFPSETLIFKSRKHREDSSKEKLDHQKNTSTCLILFRDF